jgi:hypothetical protein
VNEPSPEAIKSVVAWSLAEFGAGNRVLIEAENGVQASQVQDVVKAVSGAGAKALPVETVAPGVRCDEEGASCPSVFPVVFSGATVPSSRKLTEEPVAKVVAPKPPPAPKPPAASAKFCDKGDLKKVMNGKKGKFKFCFERQLQMYPELKGRVVTKFIIPEGQTKAGSVKIASSELKNDKVHGCLIKTIKKLNFNKPDGGACTVKWPFNFK